jgi:hypothetical protein
VDVKVETITPRKKKHAPVIDVEAIILSGGKKSVTNKTVEAMTPHEKLEIIGSAGKSLMVQAKKGLRKEAMTVSYNLL